MGSSTSGRNKGDGKGHKNYNKKGIKTALTPDGIKKSGVKEVL